MALGLQPRYLGPEGLEWARGWGLLGAVVLGWEDQARRGRAVIPRIPAPMLKLWLYYGAEGMDRSTENFKAPGFSEQQRHPHRQTRQ